MSGIRLELNGYRLTASEEDAAQAALSLAACTLDEEGFVTFLRVNTVCDIRCGKIIRRKNTSLNPEDKYFVNTMGDIFPARRVQIFSLSTPNTVPHAWAHTESF